MGQTLYRSLISKKWRKIFVISSINGSRDSTFTHHLNCQLLHPFPSTTSRRRSHHPPPHPQGALDTTTRPQDATTQRGGQVGMGHYAHPHKRFFFFWLLHFIYVLTPSLPSPAVSLPPMRHPTTQTRKTCCSRHVFHVR